jgi:hypothetical protein
MQRCKDKTDVIVVSQRFESLGDYRTLVVIEGVPDHTPEEIVRLYAEQYEIDYSTLAYQMVKQVTVSPKIYKKIQVHNNWNRLTYYVGEWDERTVLPYENFSAWAKFPDGTEELILVICKPYHTTVDDHGKTYSVDTHQYCFTREINGIETTIDLKSVEININDIPVIVETA